MTSYTISNLPMGDAVPEAVIGISPDGHEGFQALVPACLMSAEEPIPRKAISQTTGG